MDLGELQRHWDAFGRQDPFWAILSHPAHRGNRWPLEEFFETGQVEVAAVMAEAARHGLPHAKRRALDFGCGAGRLTQAMADHFDAALGIDVAPSMIALAREHNRHGNRCAYEVNDRPDLSRWPDASFDLVTLLFYTTDAAVRQVLWASLDALASPAAIGLGLAHLAVRQLDWSIRYHADHVVTDWIDRAATVLAECDHRTNR